MKANGWDEDLGGVQSDASNVAKAGLTVVVDDLNPVSRGFVPV